MEFTNEIFFNKDLIKNETALITYSGKLYKEYSAEIYIVYGFGENWDYTQEKKMVETDNGFEVSIDLKDYDTFNFCFRNNYNIWDNNFGFNYIANINETPIINEITTIDSQENTSFESSEIENNNASDINENNNNIVENIDIEVAEENNDDINHIFDEIEINDNNNDVDTTEAIVNTDIKENIDIVKEEFDKNIDSIDSTENNENFDETFSELIDSILNFDENGNSNVDLESGFGLQSVDDEIKEIDATGCDDIFQELYDDIIDLKESKNSKKTSSYAVSEENLDTKKIDELMDDVLKTITEVSYSNNELCNEANNFELQSSNLPVVQEDFLDKFIDNSYNFLQKIGNGFKKLGAFLRKTAKFLFEE